MVINHNIPALFTHLSMRRADRSLGNAMQRLSTGLRINSAREDAAGLAIANKLNYQVGGLNRASENASHGVALIQTAEGALNEVHNMLQRMRELAVYAATDTLTNANRELIQIEIDQLTSEIQLISSRTEYNRMRILNGEADRITETALRNTGNITRSHVTTLFISPAVQPGSFEYDIISVGRHAHMQINHHILNNDMTNAPPMESIVSPGPPPVVQTYIEVGSSILINGTRVVVREEGETDWAGFNARLNTAMSQEGMHIPNNASLGPAPPSRYIVSNLAGSDQGIRLDVDTASDIPLLNMIFGTGVGPGGGSAVGMLPVTETSIEAVGTNAVIGNMSLLDVNGAVVPGSDALSFVAQGNKIFVRGAQGEDIRLNIQVSPVTFGTGIRFDFGNGNPNGSPAPGTQAPWYTGSPGVPGTIVGGFPSGMPPIPGTPFPMNLQIRNFGPIMLQIGPSHSNAMPVQIPRLNSETLGLVEFVGGIQRNKLNYMNQQGASRALSIVDMAVNTVSSSRARLGAYQNRLESTVQSLDVAAENTETSRSRIQDADIARESTRLAQYNVMFQAAMAILTQANQRPQQLVSLLN
ncbi:MAG: hypothetical protein FWE05_05190 [Defluviitaleaceae bacterium]|nr:hypothetical protein [Defluviitaleaceae bacterium]